jgi:hypothetical protein
MKKSEIYLQAAELLTNPEYSYGCCNAMCRIANNYKGSILSGDCGNLNNPYYILAEKNFREIFFTFECGGFYWWPIEDRESRMIALCLAAVIAASEGE